MLIDSHAHLQDKKFARDLDRVLERAEDAGIEHLVVVGDRVETSRRAVAMTRRYPFMTAAVGIHPHYESSFVPKMLLELSALARETGVVAIGEIGLDYHYPNCNIDRQKEMFVAQGRLAGRRGLPLVIHCRDAYDDLSELIEQNEKISRRGIIHCFSGSYEQARRFLTLGFYLGIGGALTYPNGVELRHTVERLGLDRIVVETDSPYLPPQVKRGRRNEPSYLKHTIKALADVSGFSYQDVARMTRANALRVLGLPGKIATEAVFAIRRELHVTITNECPNCCRYCPRNSDYYALGYHLKLDRERAVPELLASIGDPTTHDAIVLSGLGEPTMRWDACLEMARDLKRLGARVVLDTNGLGSLVNKRDIAPEMTGLFDGVRINMVAQDRQAYNFLSQTTLPDQAFDAMLAFAGRCRDCVPEVTMNVLTVPAVDVEACRALAEDRLKACFRVNEYHPVGRVMPEVLADGAP
jgi:TatD DNase family protein